MTRPQDRQTDETSFETAKMGVAQPAALLKTDSNDKQQLKDSAFSEMSKFTPKDSKNETTFYSCHDLDAEEHGSTALFKLSMLTSGLQKGKISVDSNRSYS